MLIRTLLIFILSISCSRMSYADETKPEYFELPLNDETSISITKFGNNGDRLLWLPSEFGIQQRHQALMTALSDLGHEVWLADLHASYFVPFGRKAYTTIPVEDISSLIDKSLPEDNRKLFIVSTGRGAALALLALDDWQRKTHATEKFGGIIMIHPNVQADTPAPGTALRYLPIVNSTQLPIFIIQPQKSEKYWYLNDLVEKLTASGSKVYTQVIQQVSDGYHIKQDARELEKQITKTLPTQIDNATRLLAKTEVTAVKRKKTNEPWRLNVIPEALQSYPGNTPAPALVLNDTEGKPYDLLSYRGKVVVVNFWASWCRPCVEEIPSLGRLQKAFPKNELLVLSVNIGDTKTEIESFLAQNPAHFPVLLNTDGSVFKRWKVVAFPTTFVINKNGIIELAYYGALEWDKPEVIKQLQAVIDVR